MIAHALLVSVRKGLTQRTFGFKLPNTVPSGAARPVHTVLGIHFQPRLELRLLQVEVVDSADASDQKTGESGRYSVHESAANGAEMIRHRVPAGDRLVLGVLGELVLAANVLGLGIAHDEV